MANDERILKKIGKLLKVYGVADEEIKNHIEDFKNLKDDEDYAEQPTEQVDQPNVEEQEEPTENETVDEEPAIEQEQPLAEEQVVNDNEAVGNNVEQPPLAEEPGIEPQPDENSFDFQEKYEETIKTIEGLSARLETLEDVVSKLGVEKQDETLGASPSGTPVDEAPNDSFNDFMRKRIG